MRQIGFADLVSPTHVEVIRDWIDQQIHRIRIIESTRCDVPLEILLAVGRFDSPNSLTCYNNCEDPDHQHRHVQANDLFETWSFETAQPMSTDKLQKMVRQQLPASVIRCKGIIQSIEAPNKRNSLQAVGRRIEVQELDEWKNRPKRSQIVAIGSKIDSDTLNAMFPGCIA